MKRIFFLGALILSLNACDNTKVQLRAPETDSSNTVTSATAKSDSGVVNPVKKDSVISN